MKVSVIIPVWNQEKLLKRAVESIPKRDDIEVIVVNDGSTDNTSRTIAELKKSRDLIAIEYAENKGVGYALNRGLEIVSGEYVVLLGSDDYFYPERFLKVMDELDGTDIVYFDLEINSGAVWRVTPVSARKIYCGSVKFMRREFIEGLRNNEKMYKGEDWFFFQDILKRKPTEKATKIAVKHYNFPRKGSLTATRPPKKSR